jgi:hypothetical protein
MTMSDGVIDYSKTTELLLMVLPPLDSKILVTIIMSPTATENQYGDGRYAKTSLKRVNRYRGRGE